MDLTVHHLSWLFSRPESLDVPRAETWILGLFSEELAPCNKCLDIKIVQMSEGISLINVLLLLVYDFRVPCKDNTPDKVRCLVYLCHLLATYATIALFNFVFRLHLNHLTSLPDQVIPSRHQVSLSLLVLLKALQIEEPNVVHGAPDWHVNYRGHFGKDR